ncbi:hypothetical protein BESB_016050 [Besnoitia besnoiti]|uniref:Transmembrane protein n=1 Tax=Besnoitia besnoiti TaxID=94643 RepID=A0A2A9M9K1_BESBE|nr:hypothetical protein BESB_016050 [Besnoitia besnoiti]PFH32287.1 hypothetical protein BESB_016050 [Besnoitia besnoiti]
MAVQQALCTPDTLGQCRRSAKKFRLPTLALLALFALLCFGSPLVQGGGTDDDEYDGAMERVLDLALELLEERPIDMTVLINAATKCCVRGKFEKRFRAIVLRAVNELGERVDVDDVHEELLDHVRRRHWIYRGNASDPTLATYNELRSRTTDKHYFDED